MTLLVIILVIVGCCCWFVLSASNRFRSANKAKMELSSSSKAGWMARLSSLQFGSRKPAKPPKSSLTRYGEYEMNSGEIITSAAAGAVLLGMIGFIFYQNVFAVLVLACGGLYAPVLWKRELIRKRKTQLQLQFKQALSSLSSALGAGNSVETAFKEALNDLRLLYPDSDAFIIKELETVNRRIENGETIELALKDWSDRAEVEDIQQFTEVFMTCKRTGGNLVHVIRRTALIIQEKLDIQQDIHVMMSQKRFESKVLTFAPLVVVAVLNLSSPDYMEPLYQGSGLLTMTVALLVLIGCYAITKWIMDIKV
ncbi:pilus assembly protein TadB [Paenibacillus sp. H1-7]|uniref:type II secretion system F family protein n=1 Tax=Paenibacillus sp. H1-7 TaxID=2282849 RepID=UPI001EF7D629|nr:type II secretion system F family protein [Paenibacillus sp. H1-7]ULL15741.1 pilus assembly protein TadB [Paenibacillus sp. H1-7]